MARDSDRDDEQTKVYDSANQRPKTETQRGHDGAGRPATRAAEPPPFGTVSDQIRLISMKTPDEIIEKRELKVEPPSLKLRGLAEVRSDTPPGGMGRLAPPRDEKQVRARRRKDLMMWTAAVLVIGGLVMALVVLLARR